MATAAQIVLALLSFGLLAAESPQVALAAACLAAVAVIELRAS